MEVEEGARRRGGKGKFCSKVGLGGNLRKTIDGRHARALWEEEGEATRHNGPYGGGVE